MPSDLTSTSKDSNKKPLLSISGSLVSHAHSTLGFLAFSGALLFALTLHYEKVVKNGVARYPDEWFPSVSATIGDWYPERNWFQVLIAFMSGPRILLVLLSSLLVSLSNPKSNSKAITLFTVGFLRTIACAGWVYVTSSDDHDFHDIAMGLYLILTPPWMWICSGSLAPQPPSGRLYQSGNGSEGNADQDEKARKSKRLRRIASLSFFACIPFMVHFFIRHKVKRIPGAYSYYAYFEWGLIVFDLMFDAASCYDLSRLEIQVVESKSSSSSNINSSTIPIGGTWVEGGSAASIASGAWSTTVNESSSSKEQEQQQQQQQQPEEVKKIKNKDEVVDLGADLTPSISDNFGRELLSFISDAYLSYCAWTTFTSLHPTIFFFSVWNMGIGGHEALLISQVLGLVFVLAISPLRSAFVTNNGKNITVGPLSPKVSALLHFLSLVGISSFILDSMLARLLATAFSSAVVAVGWAVRWGESWENVGGVSRESSIWLVDSTNGGKQHIGLPIALLCVLEVASRSSNRSPPASSRKSTKEGRSSLEATAASLGLGALIYALHTFLTDSGTMIAWSWTGYPRTGPNAISHGFLVLIASVVGVVTSVHSPELAFNPFFLPFGFVSFATLLFKDDWQSFGGAVGVAFFLPVLAPNLLRSAMRHHPLKISLGIWLVANVLTFLGVLTVAYAFVPGGKVMREKSLSMIVVSMAFLSIGTYQAWRTQDKRGTPSKANSSSPFMVFRGRLLILITLPLIAIVCSSVAVPSIFWVNPASIKPSTPPEERVFTAGIWTIHFALDQKLRDSTRRMSNLMGDLGLDVIGLLESDLHRPVFGNRDLTLWLAQELGMYADIGPGPDKHTWGATLLSKFPIVNSTHHLLPSPNGELAPAIHAVLDIHGVLTDVLVSHNGQEEDPLDRELQTTEIARILSETYPRPAVFLGYVVTEPHAKRPNPYEILIKDGKMLDVEPEDLKRWCEYIAFRGLERIAYVRVSRYTVTDTELQTAKFLVPQVGETIPPDVDVRPRLIWEHEQPNTSWYYPSKFVDPPAMVYDRHKYSPYYWPRYYVPQDFVIEGTKQS